MVQKKVLQGDDVKFHKLLGNLKSSSSSFQHQESMYRGIDTKIMKKQRQNMCSSSFRKQISQPGKPPPPSMAATSFPSKMQSLIKISEKKPNYMKPTNCSDAKKENLQANFKKKDKGPSKLVRTLTKTTSFKPARTVSKKSHPFVEKESLNVQRSTCSSILKDSKFPDYLMLNSGGNEGDGTSVMKVCHYTYCSLNGHHHHPPLPPLRSFLSARRHNMKTQKSIKAGCLSPHGSRQNSDVIIEENETLQMSFQVKVSNEEDDFFIQIYSKESEAGDKDDEAIKELESSPLCEIDYHESCNGNSDTSDSDIYSADYSPKDNHIENSSGTEIQTMEDHENQEDGEESRGFIIEDIKTFSSFDSEMEMVEQTTLYLDDQVITPEESIHNKEDEIKNNYFEAIMGSDADSDQDFKIDESFKISSMQSDDEIEELDIYKYDEIDNNGSIPISEMDSDNSSISENVVENDEKLRLSEEMMKSYNIISICDSSEDVENISYIENNDDVLKQDENQEIDPENLNDDIIALCSDSEPDFVEKYSSSPNGDAIDEDISKDSKIGRYIYKQKESILDEHESMGFNPRGPNFLEVEQGPESEKVDLKHQMIDDRRNSEEWMLDYALQQAVNKLAVARKKKVTLLVEAFETVSPLPKWEKTQMRVGFGLQNRIQACR